MHESTLPASTDYVTPLWNPAGTQSPAREPPGVTSTIGIFVKDAGLVCEIADELGFDAPLVAAARDRFLAASESGLLHRDDSQVIRTYRSRPAEG